jgi:hypothetical protein
MVSDTQRKVKLTISSTHYPTRAATRASLNSAASGSLYDEEDADGTVNSDIEEDDAKSFIEDDGETDGVRKARGIARRREKERAKKRKAKKSDSVEYADYDMPMQEEINNTYVSQSGRRTVQTRSYVESSDNDDIKSTVQPAPKRSIRRPTVLDSEEDDHSLRKSARLRSNRQIRTESVDSFNSRVTESKAEIQKNERAQRLHKRNQITHRDPSYEEEDADAEGEANPDMVLDDDAVATTPEPEPQQEAHPPPRRIGNISRSQANRGYSLRTRPKNINYVIPPPLDHDETLNHFLSKPTRSRTKPKGRMNWNMNGTELSRAMGLPLDDTVSATDYCNHFVHKDFVVGLGCARTISQEEDRSS